MEIYDETGLEQSIITQGTTHLQWFSDFIGIKLKWKFKAGLVGSNVCVVQDISETKWKKKKKHIRNHPDLKNVLFFMQGQVIGIVITGIVSVRAVNQI